MGQSVSVGSRSSSTTASELNGKQNAKIPRSIFKRKKSHLKNETSSSSSQLNNPPQSHVTESIDILSPPSMVSAPQKIPNPNPDPNSSSNIRLALANSEKLTIDESSGNNANLYSETMQHYKTIDRESDFQTAPLSRSPSSLSSSQARSNSRSSSFRTRFGSFSSKPTTAATSAPNSCSRRSSFRRNSLNVFANLRKHRRDSASSSSAKLQESNKREVPCSSSINDSASSIYYDSQQNNSYLNNDIIANTFEELLDSSISSVRSNPLLEGASRNQDRLNDLFFENIKEEKENEEDSGTKINKRNSNENLFLSNTFWNTLREREDAVNEEGKANKIEEAEGEEVIDTQTLNSENDNDEYYSLNTPLLANEASIRDRPINNSDTNNANEIDNISVSSMIYFNTTSNTTDAYFNSQEIDHNHSRHDLIDRANNEIYGQNASDILLNITNSLEDTHNDENDAINGELANSHNEASNSTTSEARMSTSNTMFGRLPNEVLFSNSNDSINEEENDEEIRETTLQDDDNRSGMSADHIEMNDDHLPEEDSERSRRIDEEYQNIISQLDEPFIRQISTLSNLLETLTTNTLRRLVNPDRSLISFNSGTAYRSSLSSSHPNDEYYGNRIDLSPNNMTSNFNVANVIEHFSRIFNNSRNDNDSNDFNNDGNRTSSPNSETGQNNNNNTTSDASEINGDSAPDSARPNSSSTTAINDDYNLSDHSFYDFLRGLRDEHLLTRELGQSYLNSRNRNNSANGINDNGNRDMRFSRAFSFNNTSYYGVSNPSNGFQRLIPVLIVGVVGINNGNNNNNNPLNDSTGHDQQGVTNAGDSQVANITDSSSSETSSPNIVSGSATDRRSSLPDEENDEDEDVDLDPFGLGLRFTRESNDGSHEHSENVRQTDSHDNETDDHSNTSRSWIIIVMIHHYGSDDPILQSLPLFVNLLLEFSIHSADPNNTVDLPSDPFENTPFSDILNDLDSNPDGSDNFNANSDDETSNNDDLLLNTYDSNYGSTNNNNTTNSNNNFTYTSRNEQIETIRRLWSLFHVFRNDPNSKFNKPTKAQLDKKLEGISKVRLLTPQNKKSECTLEDMSTENTDADADLSEIPKDEYTDKIDMTEEEENQDLQQTEEDESDEYSFDKFFKRELKIASSNNSGKDKTDIQSYPVRNYAPGDTCPICLMAYEDDQFVRELPKCNHEFHKECIDEWLSEGQNTCPMCRGSGISI
ncbi:hypothetical protein B5S30_g1974 [[Candida] boidinii]|nr:hypothetical protein B5S30_g1974 [[Candida] boidinii]GMG01492.1 unnamed protein product [[Candida] boidinii]